MAATGNEQTFPEEQFRQLTARIQTLRTQGDTSSEEYKKLMALAIMYKQRQQQSVNSLLTMTNGSTTGSRVVSFTPEQVASLRFHQQAFALLSKGQPLPQQLLDVLSNPAEALRVFQTMSQSSQSTQNALSTSTPSVGSLPVATPKIAIINDENKENEEEEDKMDIEEVDGEYPYQAFLDPRKILQNSNSLLSRKPVIIPSLTPVGLDAALVAEERNRFIQARVFQRITELERLPTNLNQDSSLKLKALIELKSLQLLNRQKLMREQVVHALHQTSALPVPTDRARYRRSKKMTLRDARLTDDLEKKQRIEREQRAKQKHLDHLVEITKHAAGMISAHQDHHHKYSKLGRSLLKFHVDAEKEEQKRVERLSKERLKALRADDEEGYLKLIDTAKDTRITHLLRQTDSFLESLATKVAQQQSKAKGRRNIPIPVQDNVGTVDESSFGAAPVFAEDEGSKDKVDYYNVAHRIKESITKQPSILVGGTLKPYQLKGLEWMVSLYNNCVNGILADEMGLGKTIQTISLITFLIEVKKQNGPYLVIVPLSTMPNWILEFEKWAPSVRMISYKGTPTQRKHAQSQIRMGGFQVLLTTYEYIIKDRPLLSKIKWLHMIIDEGHRMKNTQSKLSVTLTQYYDSAYRLILTGTPLQNNLPELWALLNFALPDIFGSVKSFDEWFNAPFANTGGQDKIEINEEESLLVIKRLHKVLRPFLLRRLKKDVEADLPDKVERVIKCKMSSLQLKLTHQIKKFGMLYTEVGGTGEGKSKATGIKGLQNQIMQLRKICNHPFCFEPVERSIDPTGVTNDSIYRVAGKFEILDRILPKLFATGHRVLMFFQMTTVMTIFEDYLAFRRIQYLRLDGTTKHEDRATLLKKFNDPQSTIPIFILSTRAGGLGLNLQTADTVIIFDSDWNPHQDLQAQDRAHRIGQKKEVRILRLVTERSVEEHVMAGASKKIEMDKKVIQAGRYDNKSTAEERDQFLRALLETADEDPEEEDDIDEAAALNEAIARGEEERIFFTNMDAQRKATEEAAWYTSGRTDKMPERLIQEWELPEVYRMDHSAPTVEEDITEGSRRRNNVQYDDGMTEAQFMEALQASDDDDGPKTRRGRKPANDPLETRGKRAIYDSDDDEPSKKRKRGSQRGSATPSAAEIEDRPTAKRGRKGALTPAMERLKEMYNVVIDAMEDLDNPELGHQCSGLFAQLPSKRDYPHYYVLTAKPISLKEIKKKINNGSYAVPSEFQADVQLMLRNALTFNEDSSIVYRDARLLEEVFNKTYGDQMVQYQGTRPDPVPPLQPHPAPGLPPAATAPVIPLASVTSLPPTINPAATMSPQNSVNLAMSMGVHPSMLQNTGTINPGQMMGNGTVYQPYPYYR